MDELIGQLTSKLGIDASVAKGATEKALAMVKEYAGDDLFSQISAAIPGASDAAAQGAAVPAQTAGGGGGMLGKLAGMASGALGSSAGGTIEFGSSLSAAGLDTSQIQGFATTLVEFIRGKVGDDVMDQIFSKVPMLKTLTG